MAHEAFRLYTSNPMSLIHAAIYLALSAQVSNLNPPVVMEYKSDVSTCGVNAISNLDVNNF